MPQLLDFATALIAPEAIKAAGYAGVIGYFSESRPGANFAAKPLRRDYCDQLRALGLEIVSNYQYGKGDTSDWLGGYDAGARHAEIAQRYHAAAGGSDDRPIYAPVDSDPTLQQWNAYIAPFLRGWSSVLGPKRTGMYGNSKCIDWALEDGVAHWFWQHNWGTPKGFVHPVAHLHQFEIDQRTVGGVGVDVNEVLKPDYGQWSVASNRGGGTVGHPLGTGLVPYREQMNGLWNEGNNTKQLIVQHTTESEGGNTSVVGFLERTQNGSYQTMVDFDGEEVRMVPDDKQAWAAMAQGNRRGLHVCAMGRAEWSRDRWLQEGRLLERTAMRYAEWSQLYGIPLVKISAADAANGVRGIVGHIDITEAFHESDHWDPGHNFPYDPVIARASEINNSTTTPEESMSLADEELGKRFASRSKYRANDDLVDTLAGFVLNIDARIHEDHVEREALKGVDWAIALVKREADAGDEGASAVFAQIQGGK